MADLRELLHDASPPAADEADLDDLRSRITRRRRTRRALAATVIVAAVPLLGVALAQLRPTFELFDPPPRRIEFSDTQPEPSEPADRQAWEVLELRPVSERHVVLERRYKDGTVWMLAVRLFEDRAGEPVVCIELRTVGCVSVPGRDGEPWSVDTNSSQNLNEVPRQCAYGILAPRVDRVRLDFSDGTSLELEPVPTSLEIRARVYGHCWQGTVYASDISALDAQGNVLGHVERSGPG